MRASGFKSLRAKAFKAAPEALNPKPLGCGLVGFNVQGSIVEGFKVSSSSLFAV